MGMAGSPKCPMPKTVAQMTRIDNTNAAAIANVGGYRAANQNSSGSSTQPGLNESQESVGWVTICAASKPIRAITPTPPINSLWEGGSSHMRPIPTTSGPVTMMPMTPPRNQVRHTSRYGAAVCNKVIVVAPPTADTAGAMVAAARKPSARRRSLKLNAGPNQRSSNQATSTASPALQKPLKNEVARLLSLKRLAAMVPAITPITTAGRARRPNVIRMPAAKPEAGQKTATSDGAESSASPSRAARK